MNGHDHFLFKRTSRPAADPPPTFLRPAASSTSRTTPRRSRNPRKPVRGDARCGRCLSGYVQADQRRPADPEPEHAGQRTSTRGSSPTSSPTSISARAARSGIANLLQSQLQPVDASSHPTVLNVTAAMNFPAEETRSLIDALARRIAGVRRAPPTSSRTSRRRLMQPAGGGGAQPEHGTIEAQLPVVERARGVGGSRRSTEPRRPGRRDPGTSKRGHPAQRTLLPFLRGERVAPMVSGTGGGDQPARRLRSAAFAPGRTRCSWPARWSPRRSPCGPCSPAWCTRRIRRRGRC